MGFSSKVKEEALVACGRHCCICHKFCGIKIELHHIRLKGDSGEDTFENCIPLCFDCHADMKSYDSKHPKGTKYTEGELKRHRDNWYKKVEESLAIINLPEHLELDRATYKRLKEILPWDGSVHFVRTNSFAGFSFPLDRIDDLDKFVWECKDPTFEFIDSDLEGLRAELIAAILSFIHVIGSETFPSRNPGFNSVPPEWEDEQPERFWEVVNQLHEIGSQIGDTYDSLVKLSRRKLGIQ